MKFIQVSELLSNVKKEDRVVFLLRHAERRHITREDPQFGALVGLTEAGKAQAFKFGASLPSTEDAAYYSSPVGRCKETAAFIAKGRGDTDFDHPSKIEEMDALGNFFIKDFQAYEEALKTEFYQELLDYLKDGEHPAFLPLKETCEKMLETLIEKSFDKWTFFLSHDAWIIPCLAHFIQMDFSLNRWINFLSGMAIVISPSGYKVYPVTGLPDGYIHY